jgi:hypothetical protein
MSYMNAPMSYMNAPMSYMNASMSFMNASMSFMNAFASYMNAFMSLMTVLPTNMSSLGTFHAPWNLAGGASASGGRPVTARVCGLVCGVGAGERLRGHPPIVPRGIRRARGAGVGIVLGAGRHAADGTAPSSRPRPPPRLSADAARDDGGRVVPPPTFCCTRLDASVCR